jgi:hypothetical protein
MCGQRLVVSTSHIPPGHHGTKTSFEQNFGEIPDDELKKYKQIGSESESRFEKDIKYYVFDCPLGEPPNLMKPDELTSIDDKDFIFWPGLSKEAQANTLPLTRKHFITGHEEILKDYNEAGGDIRIQWMPKQNR